MFEDQQDSTLSPETEIESMYQNAQLILDNLTSSRVQSRAQTGMTSSIHMQTPGSRLAML